MKCPWGHEAQLTSPDYGRGAEFYGRRFVSGSPQAMAESAASKSISAANAALLGRPADPEKSGESS